MSEFGELDSELELIQEMSTVLDERRDVFTNPQPSPVDLTHWDLATKIMFVTIFLQYD